MSTNFENARYYMALADLYGEEHPPWDEVVAERAEMVASFQSTITKYEQGIVACLTGKGTSEFVDEVDMFAKLTTIGQDDRAVAYRVLRSGAGSADAKSTVVAFKVAMHRLRTSGRIKWQGHGDYTLVKT